MVCFCVFFSVFIICCLVWSIGIILHELLSGERPPRKQILDQPSLPRLVAKNPGNFILSVSVYLQ